MIQPILTIVIPVYNSAGYLDRCLKNLNKMIDKNIKDVEVLFIDDGSTDLTMDYLKQNIKNKKQYKIISKKHTGVSDTRNLGIKKANGRYITFLDSDDKYCEKFIPNFLLQTKNNPDIVWNDVINLQKNHFKIIKSDEHRLALMKMVLGISKQKIQEGIASKFYRTDFLRKNNLLFNEKVVISEDTLFILQALSTANSIYLSNKKFYFILDEHSLNRFNPKTLEGELEFRTQISFLLKKYKQSEDKKLIDDRTKINGFCTLIYRYFGPLIANNRMSLNKCQNILRDIARRYEYSPAFRNKKLDQTYSKRYKLLRILLGMGLYKFALRVDLFLDRIKNTKWNI